MPDHHAPDSRRDATDLLRSRLMAEALGRLLDRVPGSREVLRHLAALERSLLRQGLSSIECASDRTLQRICAQLGSLPQADEDPALHDLLDRVAHALDLRLAERHDDLPFDIERTVVIQEISHSMFRAAEHEHAPTVREARL
ncbi:MAG: hypothetical protein U1F56_10785 [Rubrivivax sp.]